MPDADCTSILKALSDRTRMRLVKALLAGEDESVNDLSERLDLSQYNVSKHLRILKHAGIVDMRAVAQRREYFVAKPFRKRLQKEGMTLDFGCCSFDFSKLPDCAPGMGGVRYFGAGSAGLDFVITPFIRPP